MARASKYLNRAFLRSAKEVRRYRILMRVLPIVLSCLTLVSAISYISAVMYNRYGSFTVTINKFDKLEYGLSLSETYDRAYQVSRLNARAAEDVTNINETELPANIDEIDGEHNGDNYIAYTFYVTNTGQKAVNYEYHAYIVNSTNSVEEAVRVKIYVSGIPTTYAKTRSDGGGREEGTTAFQTRDTVTRRQIDNFKPGQFTKFTVVIWLEGEDPDCLDNIVGGQFKIDMSISVISESEVQ